MSKLFILKLGSTYPGTELRIGDTDQWMVRALGPLSVPTRSVNAEQGEDLPEHSECAAVVMTGSHAMVTDNLDWSVNIERWLRGALSKRIPVLGVCYGHQLLARAAGGHVDYHPQGREIGTVEIRTTAHTANDPLFGTMPEAFDAHVTHAQSVIELPDGAIHLASNAYEPHHAFRIGECAWGVQFHPEFDTEIMREYIHGLAEKLKSEGRDVDALSDNLVDTPIAERVMRRFGEFVETRTKSA